MKNGRSGSGYLEALPRFPTLRIPACLLFASRLPGRFLMVPRVPRGMLCSISRFGKFLQESFAL